MNKKRIIKRIFFSGFMIFIGICTFFLLYTNLTFSHIQKDLRIMGVISDILLQFDDRESLIHLSENTPTMPMSLSEEVQKDEIIISIQGNNNLRLLILSAKEKKESVPVILWLHGGGYAIQKPEDELSLMQEFVEHDGSVVIAPDYTLSVVSPYPTALEECYDTLLWIHDNATELGVDTEKIIVAGGSAGGGLTAALSLMARDRGEVSIAFQMPLYPMIDYKNIPVGNEEKMLIWDLPRNEVAWQVYLGELYKSDSVPNYASPLYAEDFSNLPPTYTFVGTEDPFYAETLSYIQKLQDADVPVTYNIYEGAYHGFNVVAPNAAVSKESWSDLFSVYDSVLTDD